MKAKRKSSGKEKDKILKAIKTDGLTIRNRNVQTTFRKYQKPDLKRNITNVEDSNWLARHGNNLELYKKAKQRKQILKRVVIISILLTFLFLIVCLIGVGTVYYLFLNFNPITVYTNSTSGDSNKTRTLTI